MQCNTSEKAVGGGGLLTTGNGSFISNKGYSAYPIDSAGNPPANGGTATGWRVTSGGGLAATDLTIVYVICAS